MGRSNQYIRICLVYKFNWIQSVFHGDVHRITGTFKPQGFQTTQAVVWLIFSNYRIRIQIQPFGFQI